MTIRNGACVLAVLTTAMLTQGIALADATLGVSAEDYARAERFLSRNKERYVINADIQHHWIGSQDRFWYWRTNTAGEKECVVVDAASGRRTSASFCTAPGKVASAASSPDGKWVAYLDNHNIWIRPAGGGEPFALTTDGVENYDYADAAGNSTRAATDMHFPKPAVPHVLWSPDSRFLLTYRMDQRQVKDLFLIQSVPEDGGVRPKLYTYRYALPGDEHVPLLEPAVFDVAARTKVGIGFKPSTCCSSRTLLEKRETWWSANSKTVYCLERDRFSKWAALQRADLASGKVSEVLRATGDTIVATNANGPLDFPLVRTLKNGDVIWYSSRDGWGHLYYYSAAGKLRNAITRGNWAVRGIARVDETAKTLYFMASGREPERDPYEQYLYRIRFDGSGLKLLTPETADHDAPRPRSAASFNVRLSEDAELGRFSPSGRYFLDSYSRPQLPPIMVLRTADGRLIRQLEQADIAKLREGGHTPIEPFEVLAADGKTAIYGNLFRPSRFDATRKYPLIDAIYPGPQAIRTRKRFTAATFDSFEAQSLAELGFIVVTIDGRGTPNRSQTFLDHSYGRLDKASDLEDHIAGIRQLAQRYPYIDLKRVGVDGPSGGGYAAAHAILAYPDFYKVAVAAEGNHDAAGYTVAWGETFVGPYDKDLYAFSSNISLAKNLKGKLLLMHGEVDDNVSPALTLKLVDALIEANKDFDLIMLPNANHTAFAASTYFIRRKWDYFVRNLLGAEPPVDYAIEP